MKDSNAPVTSLFTPFQLGKLTLRNRIVMAPLTRSRALASDVPTPLAAEYYAQRAGAGLIIAEATQISPQGKGYAFTPGIYNQEQVQAWKKITAAVHEQGGHIFLQLWHVGRVSHPSLQPGNALPVAPSAIGIEGNAFTETGLQPFVTPRALETAELPGIVQDYKRAAELAIEAGFDGVEVHAANGYLLQQFLSDGSNLRQDAYGGSIENRSRLLLEVMDAVTAAIGAQRVGIRLSPLSPFNGVKDSHPQNTYLYVVQQLNRYKLAYLHVVEGATGGPREVEGGFDLQILRRAFDGVYMANNGYDKTLAQGKLDHSEADLIAFGRPFIANPDLVTRLQHDLPLAQFDPARLYGGGAEGYTDYAPWQAAPSV